MQELTIEIKTLSSLKNNNSFYEKLIKTYSEKLKVVSDFSNREDFIKEEIKRIEDLFIQPFQTTIGGDFRVIDFIDFSKFIKIAFDYLKQGMDLEIEKIVKQGQNEYRDFTKLHSGIDLTNSDLTEVKTSVIHSLEKGIGFLLYQTYLKKQLEAIPESKQIKEKKAEMTLLQIWDNDNNKSFNYKRSNEGFSNCKSK